MPERLPQGPQAPQQDPPLQSPPPPQRLHDVLAALRRAGREAEAHALLVRAAAEQRDARLDFLAWQHEPFWWQPVTGPRVRLRRRAGCDVALVRRCWADPGFLTGFNRFAARLPGDDATLHALLERERAALASERRALHLTIEAGDGTVGLVSFTDIAFGHRRAEFLIGVTGGTPARWAAEATLLALDHAAGALRLERLVAYFYPDNRAALSAALGMGFREEGVLRGHVRDAASGRRSDLLVAGVLLDEAWRTTTARLRSRLLDRVA